MPQELTTTESNAIQDSLAELTSSLRSVAPHQYKEFSDALSQLDSENRVFFSGQGRSGLLAEMAAMRFMHLGLPTHVVGESTAPSVSAGDTLVLVSGSGATPVSLSFAKIAAAAGARVLLVTSKADSPIGQLAHAVLEIPTAQTQQFGGTLFEESALVALDSLVWEQMRCRDIDPSAMAAQHTTFQ